MNARMLLRWLPGVVLAGGLASAALAQETRPTAPAPESPVPPLAQAQSPHVKLSAAATDIQRLTQSGVGDAVILAYITNSTAVYGLSPDRIIYLKGAGVSSKVISAMIDHDQLLAARPQPAAETATPAPSLAVPIPDDEGPGIVVSETDWTGPSIIADDEGYAPEQPIELGPVRAPYPVRLNDPIVIMKLPSFTIPCW